MSYMNQVIKRTRPLTRCQCAVSAILTDEFATVHDIWKRGAVYVSNKYGRVRPVAYGTICSVLASLVQQGYAQRRKRLRTEYRRTHTSPEPPR